MHMALLLGGPMSQDKSCNLLRLGAEVFWGSSQKMCRRLFGFAFSDSYGIRGIQYLFETLSVRFLSGEQSLLLVRFVLIKLLLVLSCLGTFCFSLFLHGLAFSFLHIWCTELCALVGASAFDTFTLV